MNKKEIAKELFEMLTPAQRTAGLENFMKNNMCFACAHWKSRFLGGKCLLTGEERMSDETCDKWELNMGFFAQKEKEASK